MSRPAYDEWSAVVGQAEAEIAREQAVVDAALARLAVLRQESGAAERAGLRGSGGNPQAIYERDVAVVHFAGRRAALEAAEDGLVFGRLDRTDGVVHHVGRIGIRSADQHPLVIDWRAPAAAAFYRATPARPGDVVRRRTITCRGERVVGIEDELLDPTRAGQLEGSTVVGDGAFLAALSWERTGRMRDIVATIQREQDEVIRAPEDGMLVVTGGPGTGKTVVALHRVAYLMYTHRERYGRRGVLVVGPSPVFVDYIGQVLPTLGETSARLVSLDTLVPQVRVTARDDPATAAVKGRAELAHLLARAVRAAGRRPLGDLRVVLRGRAVSVTAAEQSRRRGRLEASARSHNGRRPAARAALVDLVVRSWLREAGAQDWPERAVQELREEAAADLRDEPAFEAALDALWPVLTAEQVFADLRTGASELPAGVLDAPATELLRRAWQAGGGLTAGDAALLDELAELVGEPPPPPPEAEEDPVPDDYAEVTTTADRLGSGRRSAPLGDSHRGYAHVVVDEAQDVSPMQWRALARRGRLASWTVVGDWAQSVWPQPDQTWQAMVTAAGRHRVREHRLATNYRTPVEIAELAAQLLARIDPGAAPPAAVRTTGHPPVVLTGQPDLAAALPGVVARLGAEVSGTLGVICTPADAPWCAQVLATQGRAQVLDTWQAKGMEFDACVVVAPERIAAESPAGLRALYVALTRATQRLVVLTAADRPW